MGYKYSNYEGTVGYSGGQIHLRRGMSADPDHPLVKERPELFDDAPGQPDLRVAPAPETLIGRQEPSTVTEVDGARRDVPKQERQARVTPRPVERATRRPGEKSDARDTSRQVDAPAPVTEVEQRGAETQVTAEPATAPDEDDKAKPSKSAQTKK